MSNRAPEYTAAELMVSSMAAEIQPGDIVVQGISTPLVLSAFLLAKRRRIPDLQFLFTSGCSISDKAGPIRLCTIEELTVRGCLRVYGSPTFHGELAAALKTKEFLRPAQVDGAGNTNNVAIGRYDRPKVRLPGGVGIPDVTGFNPNLYLYVPRHEPRTLVPQVDFVSGTGQFIQALFTNLCVFGFHGGQAYLRSLHPAVTLAHVREQTGFAFSVPDVIPTTTGADAEELTLLREEIDPLGLRRLEFAGGAERLSLLREIVVKEKQQFEVR